MRRLGAELRIDGNVVLEFLDRTSSNPEPKIRVKPNEAFANNIVNWIRRVNQLAAEFGLKCDDILSLPNGSVLIWIVPKY